MILLVKRVLWAGVEWGITHWPIVLVFGGFGSTVTAVMLVVGLITATSATTIIPTAGTPTAPIDAAQAATVTGIPVLALRALLLVETVSKDRVGCFVPWWLLAGVSLKEAGHGTHGTSSIGADYVVRPPIGGPPLDGNGYALILEGGSVDYAQGPFQFISSSWRAYGMDMNGDGVNDIDNYLDAALSAANHLCKSAKAAGFGDDLRSDPTARAGVFGYNHSDDYVASVMEAAYRYQGQAGDTPNMAPPVAQVVAGPAGTLVSVQPCAHDGGCLLDASWAPYVQAALAAAPYPMVIVSAYRSVDEQVALRRKNCGTSDYAVYVMPPGDCSVVTAVPGTSNHGKGFAVDLAYADTGAGLAGPGDPAWDWLHENGARFEMSQIPSVTARDSVHFSRTGD